MEWLKSVKKVAEYRKTFSGGLQMEADAESYKTG